MIPALSAVLARGRWHTQALRGLPLDDVARLALWKLRTAMVHRADEAGGNARLAARGERWAAAWERGWGTGPDALPRWLARPGGGSFWLDPARAAEWARDGCTDDDLRLADATAAGVFELLGAGPVELGRPPRWRRDLYSGAEWPLEPSARLAQRRPDGSDIRTVWELSRGYHLPALARAHWTTGDPRYRAALVEHLLSWDEQNPLGRGPHWASPMDVALRSANWVLAMVLFAGAELPTPFVRRVLANLYASGLFLERHLEWHPVYRGNHFVANGVGLVYLGTLFRDARAGRRWLALGGRIVREEIVRQVSDDGVSFESSLAYHRLVTEMFAHAGLLLEANTPGGLPAAYADRLGAMYRFVAAYLPDDGEAPMLGDADDGRLHALSATSLLAPRRHALGLPPRWWPAEPPASGAFPGGGFYVLRAGADHAVIRCGPLGLRGAGCHDHNDQLGFELVLGGRRVVSDSGTFCYQRDLAERFAFRATVAHGVVQVGGEEQNPIAVDRPWRVLADRTRARCTGWVVDAEILRFQGEHEGYAHRPSGARCRRSLERRAADGVWTVADDVLGHGTERVDWRLHLAVPAVETAPGAPGEAEVWLPGEPGVRIHLRFPEGMRLVVESTWASERYGERHPRACLRLHGEVDLPLRIVATLAVEPA